MFSAKFTSTDDKKTIDHFQSLITYYAGELLPSYASRLRDHEKKLAQMLESRDEFNTEHITQHDAFMSELEALHQQFVQYKEEFFAFIERAM